MEASHSSYEINTSLAIPEQSVYEILHQSANDYPNRIAVIDGEKQLTYDQLLQAVQGFASCLNEKGVRKGARVAFMLPNCLEYIVSFFAVQHLGGTVVQVNHLYQSVELDLIINDSRPSWIICNRAQTEKLEQTEWNRRLNILLIEEELSYEKLFGYVPMAFSPASINWEEDVAVLQYTGGTTGKSKGAMITHKNIVSNIHQSFAVFSSVLNKGVEITLGVSPLSHAMALNNMNMTILIAGTYVILEKFKINSVILAFRKHRPTVFTGSPTMYISILHFSDLKDSDLTSLKICTSGSAPLPLEVRRELEEKSGARILEGFGQTEATTATHRTPLIGKQKLGSIGVPIPLTKAKIMDLENGEKELPVGEPGELVVKGPQVMKGYWNNEAATAETIRNSWLYTGDIAIKDEDGHYFIVGRKKDMIISGGYNIYPTEIEEVLYAHDAIAEVVVFGVPDEYLGEKVVAAIVPIEDKTIDSTQLLAWCNEMIARYKVPRELNIRKTLPKTTVGKILRRQLINEYIETE